MNQYKKNLLKKTLSLSLLLSCFVHQQRTITTPVEYTVIAGKKCNFNVNSYYDNSGTTVGDTGNIILGNGNQGGAIGIYSSKANPIQMINYAHDDTTTSGGIEIGIRNTTAASSGNKAIEIYTLNTGGGSSDKIQLSTRLETGVSGKVAGDITISSYLDAVSTGGTSGNIKLNTYDLSGVANIGNIILQTGNAANGIDNGNIALVTKQGQILSSTDLINNNIMLATTVTTPDAYILADVEDIVWVAGNTYINADAACTTHIGNTTNGGDVTIESNNDISATANGNIAETAGNDISLDASVDIDVYAGNDITQTANGAILLQANYDATADAYNCKIDMVDNRVSIISDGNASYTLRGSPTSSIQNITLGGAPSSTIEDLNKNNIFDIAHGKTLLLPYTGGQTIGSIADLEPNIRYEFANTTEGYFVTGVNTTMTMHGNGTFKLNRVAGGLGFITQEYVDEQQFSILAADQIIFTQSTTYASFADSLPVGAAFTAPADYTITVPADNRMQNCIVLAARDFTAAGNYENSVIVSGDKIILKSPSIVLNGETYFTINEINDASTYYAVVTDGNGQLFAKAKESNPALSPSSRRYKTNIYSLQDYETEQIYNVTPYSFNYKNNLNSIEYGVMAEDLVENDTLACAVRYDRQGRPDAVSYNTIMIAMLKEFQKLKARVDMIEYNQSNDQSNISDMQETLTVLQDIIYNIECNENNN
jgi:hypothetical protein